MLDEPRRRRRSPPPGELSQALGWTPPAMMKTFALLGLHFPHVTDGTLVMGNSSSALMTEQ